MWQKKCFLCTVFVVLAIALMGMGYLSYAQEANVDNDPHAMGYVPMTPQENELLLKTHPKVIKVLVNELGLQRINEGRRAKGLSPLSDSGVVHGQGRDLISAIPGKAPNRTSAGNIVPLGELPLVVDNSLSSAFPPIRSQGSANSCATFASTYYQMTHMAGLMYGWNNKNEDNTTKMSPLWSWNFVNNGENQGTGFFDIYNILEASGAPTWQEFPYVASDYRRWPLDPSVLEHAINYRINPLQLCTNIDTTAGLDQLKQILNNGYVVIFGSVGMNNWQWTRIKDDTSTNEDDAEVGKYIAYWKNGETGGHAMTIVGYNDAIWTDINKNRKIDAGEKGALRIANSWGTSWQDNGYTWVAYDALKEVSAVSGGPGPGRLAMIHYNQVYIMTLRDHYTPKLLAKFTVNHANRNQLRMSLGISETTEATPAIKWYPGIFALRGGAFAFDGSTVACDGTFVLDLTDILTPGDTQKRYYLGMLDSTIVNPATLSSFTLNDKINNIVSEDAITPGSPLVVDDAEVYSSIDYTLANSNVTNNPPLAVAQASPTTGMAPLTVHFEGSGTDTDGTITDKIWFFGEREKLTGSLLPVTDYQYIFPGVYSAKFTVKDNSGAESSEAIIINVEPDPTKQMHVGNISLSIQSTKNKFAKATVTILNVNNAAVSGATVSGHWSGLTTDIDSGVTNGSGQVTLSSDAVSKTAVGTFTFCVDNVVLAGGSYDPAANVETCASINTP